MMPHWRFREFSARSDRDRTNAYADQCAAETARDARPGLHRDVGLEQPTAWGVPDHPDLAGVLGAEHERLRSLDRRDRFRNGHFIGAGRLDHSRSPGLSRLWTSQALSSAALAP
jgi:hypothetical protein